MCLSILGLGIFFYLDENKKVICEVGDQTTTMASLCVPNPDGKINPDTVESLGWLPLTSLIIYVLAFSVGFGPLPWMMNGEFFSLESKGLASSIATAFNWLCSFFVTKFQTNLVDAIENSGSYFLYAAVCAVGVIFIFLLVPETRGKSPEDMKRYFEKKGHKHHTSE